MRLMLAPAAWRFISVRGRERHHQDCARPSSRRYRRDAVLEYVLRRAPEGHAAETAQRKSAPYRHSAAGLRGRGVDRTLCGRARVSDHSMHPVRFTDQYAEAGGEEHAARMGAEVS